VYYGRWHRGCLWSLGAWGLVTESIRLSAEHTSFELVEPIPDLRIGDKVDFLVGYGDTTVCLHDELVGVRNGIVEIVWQVLGRGKLT
jgi:D-serine deaminase-like pyridoxal phosphate-dependent protein